MIHKIYKNYLTQKLNIRQKLLFQLYHVWICCMHCIIQQIVDNVATWRESESTKKCIELDNSYTVYKSYPPPFPWIPVDWSSSLIVEYLFFNTSISLSQIKRTKTIKNKYNRMKNECHPLQKIDKINSINVGVPLQKHPLLKRVPKVFNNCTCITIINGRWMHMHCNWYIRIKTFPIKFFLYLATA